MKNIQQGIKHFIIYWFCLTLVPGLVSSTNDFVKLSLASLGFAFLLFIVLPFIMKFFKLPSKNISSYFLIGVLLNLAYTYAIKSGILSIIYFPPSAVLGDSHNKASFLRIELQEFGIILFIAVLSIVITIILDKKFR